MNFKTWLLKAADLGSKDAYYYLGKQQEDEGDIYSAIKYYFPILCHIVPPRCNPFSK